MSHPIAGGQTESRTHHLVDFFVSAAARKAVHAGSIPTPASRFRNAFPVASRSRVLEAAVVTRLTVGHNMRYMYRTTRKSHDHVNTATR